jgi:hypothetical protein
MDYSSRDASEQADSSNEATGGRNSDAQHCSRLTQQIAVADREI